MANQVTNSFGRLITLGSNVIAHQARGGCIEGRVVKITLRSSMAKAYGPQVRLHTGHTVSADDVFKVAEPVAAPAALDFPPGPPATYDVLLTMTMGLIEAMDAATPSDLQRVRTVLDSYAENMGNRMSKRRWAHLLNKVLKEVK